MGIPDGAHTHGSGGSGLGTAVLVLVGAALAVKFAGPVAASVGELVHVLLVVGAIILGVGAGGLLAFVAYRVRHGGSRRTVRARVVPPLPPVAARPVQAHSEPRPAIERSHEVHLHLHGVSAEDVAAILAHRTNCDPPAAPAATGPDPGTGGSPRPPLRHGRSAR